MKPKILDYSPNLPQEIWRHIFLLAKVPVKFLGQWRSVCKCWNDVIGSKPFIEAYDETEAGKTDYLVVKSDMSWDQQGRAWLFCTKTNKRVLPLRRPKRLRGYGFCIIGLSRGLVCISLRLPNPDYPTLWKSLVIWNPSIGKLKKVPRCLNKGDAGDCVNETAMGFGFKDRDYKIVRITRDSGRAYFVEVYSLCHDSWGRIPCVSPLDGSASVHFQRPFGTYSEGAIYWLCWVDDHSDKSILGFNIGTEIFTTQRLRHLIPQLIRTGTLDVSIGVFQDSLSLFHMREEGGLMFCEVWVRSAASASWQCIQHLMHPGSFKIAWPLSGTTDRRFHVVLKNPEFAWHGGHRLVLYDLISNDIAETRIRCWPDTYIDTYTESLMLLQ